MSAFAKRRRGSLRSPLGSATTGGKGIRTPDLLIANETLYQLSYTPKEEQQLSWRNDFSASDSENSEQPDLAGVGSLTPSAKVAVDEGAEHFAGGGGNRSGDPDAVATKIGLPADFRVLH